MYVNYSTDLRLLLRHPVQIFVHGIAALNSVPYADQSVCIIYGIPHYTPLLCKICAFSQKLKYFANIFYICREQLAELRKDSLGQGCGSGWISIQIQGLQEQQDQDPDRTLSKNFDPDRTFEKKNRIRIRPWSKRIWIQN